MSGMIHAVAAVAQAAWGSPDGQQGAPGPPQPSQVPPAQAAGPAIASMLIYVLMAVVLAIRPQGLFPVRHA